jgi:hypothetical protein
VTQPAELTDGISTRGQMAAQVGRSIRAREVCGVALDRSKTVRLATTSPRPDGFRSIAFAQLRQIVEDSPTEKFAVSQTMTDRHPPRQTADGDGDITSPGRVN